MIPIVNGMTTPAGQPRGKGFRIVPPAENISLRQGTYFATLCCASATILPDRDPDIRADRYLAFSFLPLNDRRPSTRLMRAS